MVRERKDFYQLTKAVGEDPVLEAPVVGVDTEAPMPDAGAPAVEAVGRRRKKRAHKAGSLPDTDVVQVEDDAGTGTGPEERALSEVPGGSPKKRTAREEVILVLPFGFFFFFFFFCGSVIPVLTLC